MRDFHVDLHNCEDEPIHIPGQIQPHGVLVAFDDALVVRALSTNAVDWFGRDWQELVHADLSALVGPANADVLRGHLDHARRSRVDDIRILLGDRIIAGVLYHSTGWFVLELEDDADGEMFSPTSVRHPTMELNQATDVREVADLVAGAIRTITGFDRVMVYQFDADWNGEVIAERRRDDLNTFLGLHYPSTDIPAQARELYRRNWLRIIPDISYVPSPIAPTDLVDGHEPLDLSDSTIRSVSPIHVEYLGNMGVTASMSVSIVVDGVLWGLVACHHYSGPHRPGPGLRSTVEYLGQLASVRIRECERRGDERRAAHLAGIAHSLGEILHANEHRSLAAILHEHADEVLALTGATGAAIRVSDEVVHIGSLPPDLFLRAALLGWENPSTPFVVDRLSDHDPSLADQAQLAAGLLAVSVADDRRDLAVWVRPEQVELVEWAGDPYAKEVAAERPGSRLTPRKSFELWSEVVRGRCQPWDEAEIAAARTFTRHLGTTKLRRDRVPLSIASDLMKVMLPSALPEVPGFELDAFYVPDGQGRVGGDWYDVMSIGDRTIFVVGDVTGHGLRAAATMTQARNALRAYLIESGPTHAVGRLDHLLRSTMPDAMLSLVVGVLDHATGSIELCSAGHPPALHLAADGVAFVEAPTNRLLGVVEAPFESIEVRLDPGAVLLCYTDGLVELSRRSIDDGFALLRAEVEQLAGRPLSVWMQRLGDLVAGTTPSDDITALAVRALPEAGRPVSHSH